MAEKYSEVHGSRLNLEKSSLHADAPYYDVTDTREGTESPFPSHFAKLWAPSDGFRGFGASVGTVSTIDRHLRLPLVLYPGPLVVLQAAFPERIRRHIAPGWGQLDPLARDTLWLIVG